MKPVITLITLTTALLGACSTISTPASAQQNMNIRALWQLQSAPSYSKLPEKAELDLREPQTASAYMGCNGMRFAIQIAPDSGSLKADTIMSTRMYCAEFADLESSFAQLLRSGAQVVWQEGQLTLIDKTGATWTFKQADH